MDGSIFFGNDSGTHTQPKRKQIIHHHFRHRQTEKNNHRSKNRIPKVIIFVFVLKTSPFWFPKILLFSFVKFQKRDEPLSPRKTVVPLWHKNTLS
mmetsp:Transcript_42692/g.43262  ORF Transcript_42692/g.43262 Transcript_42692/m.43262 type:complete len:95 (+) Transcript_42692:937-1221(+)